MFPPGRVIAPVFGREAGIEGRDIAGRFAGIEGRVIPPIAGRPPPPPPPIAGRPPPPLPRWACACSVKTKAIRNAAQAIVK